MEHLPGESVFPLPVMMMPCSEAKCKFKAFRCLPVGSTARTDRTVCPHLAIPDPVLRNTVRSSVPLLRKRKARSHRGQSDAPTVTATIGNTHRSAPRDIVS